MTETEEVKKLAERLVEEYMKTSPPVQPKSVLPACAYLAHIAKGVWKTQEEISLIYGVSTTTIRKVYKDILNRVGVIGDRDYDETVKDLFG